MEAFFRFNNIKFMKKKILAKTEIFTEEGIKNICRFQDTLKRIHIRLINEGYTIKDGKIEKPKTGVDKKRKV